MRASHLDCVIGFDALPLVVEVPRRASCTAIVARSVSSIPYS
jgi:hypothetical protein